jgi:hypothetical protein
MDLARREPALLTRLWPLLDRLHSGRAITEFMVAALAYIERNAANGESLTNQKWFNRLMSVGVDEMIEAGRRAAFSKGRGGPSIHAGGILDRINKGLRYKFTLIVDN